MCNTISNIFKKLPYGLKRTQTNNINCYNCIDLSGVIECSYKLFLDYTDCMV